MIIEKKFQRIDSNMIWPEKTKTFDAWVALLYNTAVRHRLHFNIVAEAI